MEEVTLLTQNNTKTHKQKSSACINMLQATFMVGICFVQG